jgi:hypothetical protein
MLHIKKIFLLLFFIPLSIKSNCTRIDRLKIEERTDVVYMLKYGDHRLKCNINALLERGLSKKRILWLLSNYQSNTKVTTNLARNIRQCTRHKTTASNLYYSLESLVKLSIKEESYY